MRQIRTGAVDGEPGSSEAGQGTLPDDATIPMPRTQPPVDLTALVNGFKPLFDALEPAQVNQLATELVGIFQGESGTVNELLNQIVAVTGNLASRDQVLARVLDNLSTVLTTMNTHRQDLTTLISGLARLTSSVAADRQQIGAALDAGTALTRALTGLLDTITPTVSHDVRIIGPLSSTLVRNEAGIDQLLTGAPGFVTRLDRTLDYGSWVNVYVCSLSISVNGQSLYLGQGPHSEVCR